MLNTYLPDADLRQLAQQHLPGHGADDVLAFARAVLALARQQYQPLTMSAAAFNHLEGRMN